MSKTNIGSIFSWFLKPITYFIGDSARLKANTVAELAKQKLAVECDQTSPEQLKVTLTHTINAWNKDKKNGQTNEIKIFLNTLLKYLKIKDTLWAEGITKTVAQTLVKELYSADKKGVLLLDALIKCQLPLNPAKKAISNTWTDFADYYVGALLNKAHYNELPEYIQNIINNYEKKAETQNLAKHTARFSVEQLKTQLPDKICEEYLNEILTAILNNEDKLTLDKDLILSSIQVAIEGQNLESLGADMVERIVQEVAPLISERFTTIFNELFTKDYSITDEAAEIFAHHLNGLHHAKVEAKNKKRLEDLAADSSNKSDDEYLEYVAFRELPSTHQSLKGDKLSREAGELIYKLVDKFLDEDFVSSLINKLRELPEFNNILKGEQIKAPLPLIKQFLRLSLIREMEEGFFKDCVEREFEKTALEKRLNDSVLPSIKQTLYIDLVQRVIYNNIHLLEKGLKTILMKEVLKVLGKDPSSDDEELMSVIDSVFERYGAFKEKAELGYLNQFLVEFKEGIPKDNLPLNYLRLALDNNVLLLNDESTLRDKMVELTKDDSNITHQDINDVIKTVMDKFRAFKEKGQINTEEQYFAKFIDYTPERGQGSKNSYYFAAETLLFEYGGLSAFFKGLIKAVKWVISIFYHFEKNITISITSLLHNYRKTPNYNAKLIERMVLQKYPLPPTSSPPLKDRVTIRAFLPTTIEEISKILYVSSKYKASYFHRFILWSTLGSDGKRVTEIFNNVLANTLFKGSRFNNSLFMHLLDALNDRVALIGGSK